MAGSDTFWWRDGVIYQIYPRSFADSNHDGLGDLPGILAHLDYLSDLGIDAIWLSPIYPLPDVDFGYDIADYNAIDPRFGSLGDFNTLVRESHRRGIHLILDLVLNQTSDQHPWFKASRSARDDPYHDWYLWHAPRPGGGPPNNWESVVDGKAWDYEPRIGQYYYHSYYYGKDRLHQVFNFDLLDAGWSPRRYLNTVQRWEAALPLDAWPCYFLNNHDQPRTACRFCHGEDDARAKIAATLLLTLRGTPFIYYGEEIGMRDISLGRNQILDPLGKRYWPFYKGRDGSRSPMQWDASPFYGFRSTEPWIPLNPDYTSRNVLAQHADQKSILNFYRSLIAIRHKVPSLQGGEFVALSLKPIHVLAYLRKIRGQMVLVVLNFSDHPQSLDLNPDIAQRKWELLLSTSQETVDPISANRLKLGPLEVLLLLIMEKE